MKTEARRGRFDGIGRMVWVCWSGRWWWLGKRYVGAVRRVGDAVAESRVLKLPTSEVGAPRVDGGGRLGLVIN